MKPITALLLATHLVSVARGEAVQPVTPTDVVASFIQEVSALASKHTELADFPEYAKRLEAQSQVEFKKDIKPFAVSFDKNTNPAPTKRRIRPSDCGTNGIFLLFALEDARQTTRQAPLDTITSLPGLGLTLYAEVVLWEKASPEFKKQLEDIIGRHKAMLLELDGKTEAVMVDEPGGTAAYTGNLIVSHRPQPGDFQGARFPAEEVRHLNKLLAKGVVVEDWKETAEREQWTPWESHTLFGSFIYADEPYQVVEIQTLRKPSTGSDLFDLKHVVMLRSGQQAGRKVVYTRNPELVTYVQGDFMRKLAEWNPDLAQKRFLGGPFHISPKDAGSLEQDLAITHKISKVATQFGELTQTAYYRGDSLILKKVTPPDEFHNTVYYVIHNGFEVLTYKTGPAGTEFAEAGIIRDMVKPDYTIKMAGDKEGRIQRITLYSPDFSKTYEGYRLRNNELIPWTAEELAGWRKMRDPGVLKEDAGSKASGLRDQPATVTAVVQSLAKRLSGLTAKYPELATYKEAEANRGDRLVYSHNFVQPTDKKRGIEASDFGKDGCFISFSTAPIPPKDRIYAMIEPTLELGNLGLYLWAAVGTGASPSKGFQTEIQELLDLHVKMLETIDSTKGESK